MSYNHGLEEKKFKEQWQKTAEEYRKAGMTEKQIAEIYEFDREVFNSNRRYREKTVGLFDNSNSRTLTVYKVKGKKERSKSLRILTTE